MNTKILQKCVDELNEEKPDISYLRGTLETLIEMEPKPLGNVLFSMASKSSSPITDRVKADEILTDEDKEYGRRMAGGPIGNLN